MSQNQSGNWFQIRVRLATSFSALIMLSLTLTLLLSGLGSRLWYNPIGHGQDTLLSPEMASVWKVPEDGRLTLGSPHLTVTSTLDVLSTNLLPDLHYVPLFPDPLARVETAEVSSVDQSRRLVYFTSADFQTVFSFYSDALAKAGWLYSSNAPPDGQWDAYVLSSTRKCPPSTRRSDSRLVSHTPGTIYSQASIPRSTGRFPQTAHFSGASHFHSQTNSTVEHAVTHDTSQRSAGTSGEPWCLPINLQLWLILDYSSRTGTRI